MNPARYPVASFDLYGPTYLAMRDDALKTAAQLMAGCGPWEVQIGSVCRLDDTNWQGTATVYY